MYYTVEKSSSVLNPGEERVDLSLTSHLREDLTCPICYQIFEDPLLLPCSHSICRVCLKKCRSNRCPVCRWQSDQPPHRNLALKNLCDAFRGRPTGRPKAPSEPPLAPGRAKIPPKPKDLCPLHQERHKLFCLEDEELLCVVCRTSERHEGHTLRPIAEATLIFKERIREDLKALEMNLNALENTKQTCDRIEKNLKNKEKTTEKEIRAEFEKLFQFLRNEEEERISAARIEVEQKRDLASRMTKNLAEEIKTLSVVIKAMEQDLRAKDTVLLKNYKDTKRRAQFTAKTHGKIPEEPDMDKHLQNLKSRVMDKMTKYFQSLQDGTSARVQVNNAAQPTLDHSRFGYSAPSVIPPPLPPRMRRVGPGVPFQPSRPLQPASSIQSLPGYFGTHM